jgi:tRNA-splicing ligase RtcB
MTVSTESQGGTGVPETITPKLLNWASILEPEARAQACRTAALDVVDSVALMPDAHYGLGATVGSVIATESAVIPAAVGVDIGCGMVASRLALTADQLPDNLDAFLPLVAKAVPAGVGKGHLEISDLSRQVWDQQLRPTVSSTPDYKLLERGASQLGSLGSGNHFLEICLDESDTVWIVLHSGSRGIGNKLAQVHIKKARGLAKALHLGLEDPDLAYFTDGTTEFKEYIRDMLWAQEYARLNREVMMTRVLEEFERFIWVPETWHSGSSDGTGIEAQRINCHHNFTQREWHEGRRLWITRKGAIKANKYDLGVIPGSMGTRSYIVRGLANPLSFNSCSHGAGRTMSRTRAKKEFTTADLAAAMGDRVWQREDADQLVDEIPAAYKDIDQVMADQTDLVTVLHTLRQVLNYKGT